MLELYQAEWCPYSHRVRQRMTELGVDFVARQVPAEPDDREAMREATGESSIPTLLLEDGTAVQGDGEILRWLNERFEERPDAERHREKAREEAHLFQ